MGAVLGSLSDVSFTDDAGDIGDAEMSDGSPVDVPPQRTRKRRSDAGQPRGSRSGNGPTKRATSDSKLIQELCMPWAGLAHALAFTAPTCSAVMVDDGERVMGALVQISAKYPKMRKGLESAGTIGPAATLVQEMVKIAIAFQIDMGRIPPNTPIANVLGVTALHEQVMGTKVVDAPPGSVRDPLRPPPSLSVNDPRHPMYSFRAGTV